MQTKLEREVRFLKLYAVFATFFAACFLLAFIPRRSHQNVEELVAKRVRIVDASGTGRVLLSSDYKKDNSAGLYFFNQQGTESGAIAHNGRRRDDGSIEAYSIITMDQFKSDEVVRLAYNQLGAQKRYGLVISDQADSLTERAQQTLNELGKALQAAKTTEEARALRREYLARVPGRELGAQRLFAGRDSEGTSMVTLSDPDGKPRLRLQVDTLGNASITFLNASGHVLRTIRP